MGLMDEREIFQEFRLWNTKLSPLGSGTWKFIVSLRNIAADSMALDTATGLWTWKGASETKFQGFI